MAAGQQKSFAKQPNGSTITVSDGTRSERWTVNGGDLTATFAAANVPSPVGSEFSVTVRNQSPENVSVKTGGQRLGAVPYGQTKTLPRQYPSGTVITVSDGESTRDYDDQRQPGD